MPTLVIPTRNRPRSLSFVLAFLERFYPSTRVVVADGSTPDFQAAVTAQVAGFKHLSIDLLPYPDSLGLFDRLLDVLDRLADEFVILGADDDYPFIDTLAQGQPFLEANPDYALATGTMLVIEERAQGELAAIIRPCRPIDANSAAARIRQYAEWPVPLSYGLSRRQTLIHRIQNTMACPMGEVFDPLAGIQDCLCGKVHAIPQISVVLTRNLAQTYWRSKSKLEFLDKGPELAGMIRTLAETLRVRGGLVAAAAEDLATRIFLRHIGTYFLALPYASQPRFADGDLHRLEIVRAQFCLFDKIFDPGTAEHAAMRERLAFIVTALAANTARETADREEIEAAISRFRGTLDEFSTPSETLNPVTTGAPRGPEPGDNSIRARIDAWVSIDPKTLRPVAFRRDTA